MVTTQNFDPDELEIAQAKLEILENARLTGRLFGSASIGDITNAKLAQLALQLTNCIEVGDTAGMAHASRRIRALDLARFEIHAARAAS